MSLSDGYIYRLERRAVKGGGPIGEWVQATNREAYTRLNTIRSLRTRYKNEYDYRSQWGRADYIQWEFRILRFALSDGEVIE